VECHCALEATRRRLMEQAMTRLGLSALAFHRVLKVARTIADLAGEENLGVPHLSEVIGDRRFDRQAAN